MIAGFIIAVLSVFGTIDVAITTADNRTIEGAIDVEALEMKTSFGSVRITADRLASIEFAKPQVVVTDDQTALRGELILTDLSVRTAEGESSLRVANLKSLIVLKRAVPKPGEITEGVGKNKMTYCLRAPAGYKADRGGPAIVILHGSNMNSKAYVQTIVSQWPEIAERHLLIGVNGEFRNANSPPENPVFNYTYVNFVGKSKYKGFPGTERESPALLAEVLEELKARLKITKVLLGGHSQGGFLTYSELMNYPELIDGAFPISAGLIFQCEPSAYEDEAVRAAQRTVPLAIVHGKNDPNVDFGMGQYAYEAFEDAHFGMLRLFTSDTAGHMFALLPVSDAIAWLEEVTSDDAAKLIAFAQRQVDAKQYRDAAAALTRLKQVDGSGAFESKAKAISEQISAAAREEAARLSALIAENKDSTWIDAFYVFREQFGSCEEAKPVLDAYAMLRAVHQKPADELFNQARGDFQAGNQQAGYAKYQQIVDHHYASSWYRMVKRYLDQRPPQSK